MNKITYPIEIADLIIAADTARKLTLTDRESVLLNNIWAHVMILAELYQRKDRAQ